MVSKLLNGVVPIYVKKVPTWLFLCSDDQCMVLCYTLLTEEDNRLFLISYTIVMSPILIGYRPLYCIQLAWLLRLTLLCRRYVQLTLSGYNSVRPYTLLCQFLGSDLLSYSVVWVYCKCIQPPLKDYPSKRKLYLTCVQCLR